MKFIRLLLFGLLLLIIPIVIIYIVNQNDKVALNFFKEEYKVKMNSSGLPGPASDTNDPTWIRENTFINGNIFSFLGNSYDIKNISEIAPSINPNPIKILIFGDAYTWGNHNTDRYSTLTAQLQSMLDAKYGKGTVEVIVKAESSVSTFSHYDYFKLHPVEKINPDLVIYNYFDNDIHPSFNESLICRGFSIPGCGNLRSAYSKIAPDYLDCIYGHGDSYSNFLGKIKFIFPKISKSLLTSHCNPIYQKVRNQKYDFNQLRNNPVNSPFYSKWEESVKLLKESLRDYKVGFANLVPGAPNPETSQKIGKVFSDAGYTEIAMNESIKVMNEGFKDKEKLNWSRINPGAGHPSSYLNHAYAQDLFNFIEGNISSKRFDQAKSKVKKSATDIDLVAFTMPVDGVNVTNQGNKSIINFQKSSVKTYQQNNSVLNQSNPFQYSNCANLGSANQIITLNENLKNGSILVNNLPFNQKVRAGWYYYDENFKMVFQDLGLIKEEAVLTLPKSSISVSLVFDFPQINPGCSITDEISTPDFNISLTYNS